MRLAAAPLPLRLHLRLPLRLRLPLCALLLAACGSSHSHADPYAGEPVEAEQVRGARGGARMCRSRGRRG